MFRFAIPKHPYARDPLAAAYYHFNPAHYVAPPLYSPPPTPFSPPVYQAHSMPSPVESLADIYSRAYNNAQYAQALPVAPVSGNYPAPGNYAPPSGGYPLPSDAVAQAYAAAVNGLRLWGS